MNKEKLLKKLSASKTDPVLGAVAAHIHDKLSALNDFDVTKASDASSPAIVLKNYTRRLKREESTGKATKGLAESVQSLQNISEPILLVYAKYEDSNVYLLLDSKERLVGCIDGM